MVCLACGDLEPDDLCARCRLSLRRASLRTLPSGLVIRSAFLHQGAARRLVHRLKYQGLEAVALWFAAEMASGLGAVTALVPVPRVLWRRLRYGVDQSQTLAAALASQTGLPVIEALTPSIWAPRRAGRNRAGRYMRQIRARGMPDVPVALVDDVVTTGETLLAASRSLRVKPRLAVTATASPRLVGETTD